MNTEKMSRWFLAVIAAVMAAIAIGLTVSGASSSLDVPLYEMTVKQLFVLVLVAAIIIRS